MILGLMILSRSRPEPESEKTASYLIEKAMTKA